ncbi:hypothetical protein EB796_005697 [Bugula neritina]|uniref:Uncharacterized protein n=1 Tax=Bugula neritina TaxID=10212 RepID=A0A7J7KBG1_BUGNE|nr:hypothetical protein EB796_005697 [Bugula neritina]
MSSYSRVNSKSQFILYYDSTSSDIHCLDRKTGVRLATLSTILLDKLSCISKLTEQLSLIFTFYATIIKFASGIVGIVRCKHTLLVNNITSLLVKSILISKRCARRAPI